jgi:DNA-directed RNA polymerase subunit RPC12/RpoP
MIVFDCAVCRTKLSAQEAQAGAWVLCPTCRTKLQVPAPVVSGVAAIAVTDDARAGATDDDDLSLAPPAPPAPRANVPRPSAPPMNRPPGQVMGGFRPAHGGKRYGFNCGYCSSRLEATESMAATDGQCPTCGNTITIPIQDRYGRLIDPKTRQIIKQDPHPVHAYAAAGDRAPAILRQADGKQIIRCPRCSAASPITANNCKSCGMPFTMEGTTLEAAGSSNGFCVAALVLGIISLPGGCTIVPPLLAIVFGSIGFSQTSKSGANGGGKTMATVGIVLGVIGLLIGIMILANR